MNLPNLDSLVVDCHNDWPLLMARERSMGSTDSLVRRFVPQFRSAGIDVQISPIYVDPEFLPEGALRRTLLLIRWLKEEAEANPDVVAVCETAAQIEAAVGAGKLALVIALEGSHAIGTDIELLEMFFEMGVRMASFTHMGDTLLGGGSGDGDPGVGLSRHGIAALEIMERLGIVMDVSHLSVRSTEDVLEHATRPLVASHSSVRSLRDHHRNLADDHVKRIAALRGVIGVPAAIPDFIDPDNPTIDRVVDHIVYIAESVGIDHVGIGADFIREYVDEVFGTHRHVSPWGVDMRATIEGLESPAGIPALAERLHQRGVQGDDLRKVLGENFLRVFREVMGE